MILKPTSAICFRKYLALSASLATRGDPDRRMSNACKWNKIDWWLWDAVVCEILLPWLLLLRRRKRVCSRICTVWIFGAGVRSALLVRLCSLLETWHGGLIVGVSLSACVSKRLSSLVSSVPTYLLCLSCVYPVVFLLSSKEVIPYWLTLRSYTFLTLPMYYDAVWALAKTLQELLPGLYCSDYFHPIHPCFIVVKLGMSFFLCLCTVGLSLTVCFTTVLY